MRWRRSFGDQFVFVFHLWQFKDHSYPDGSQLSTLAQELDHLGFPDAHTIRLPFLAAFWSEFFELQGSLWQADVSCWVGTGSGGSWSGPRDASSRWAKNGRARREADSTMARATHTNCENKKTFSERSYAHCSMYRYVHPWTFDSMLG